MDDDGRTMMPRSHAWVLLVSMVVGVMAFSVAAFVTAVMLGFDTWGADAVTLAVAARSAWWFQHDHEVHGLLWPWDRRYRKGKDQ